MDSLRTASEAAPLDSLSVDATVLLARTYFGSDLDSAFSIGQRARSQATQLDLPGLVAESENAMGIARLFQGRNKEALTHFQEVLRLREAEGDTALISGALNNLAVAYQELGEYGLALDQHIRSLALKEALGDSARIRVTYNNIGLIYEQIEDFPQARSYYRRALAIFPVSADTNAFATNLYNIGVTYFKENLSDSARLCWQQSQPLVVALQDQRMIALHEMYFGVLDQQAGALQGAETQIREALVKFEALGKQDQIVTASTYLGFNLLAQGQPREALASCQRGYAIAEAEALLSKQVECLRCLHESLGALGRKGEAYQMALSYYELRDSLANEDVHKQIVRKDLEYGFRKEQLQDSLELVQENALVRMQYEDELEDQQTLTFFMIVIGVLLLGLVIMLVFMTRSNREVSKQLEVRVKERTEELEKQKDQLAEFAFINAHLLRQPLAQILGLVTLVRIAQSQDELEHYIQLLEESAAKLDRVVHDIRDVVEAEGVPT